ncbi:hypothetical protein BJX65DRAFT_266946 [Aspergillus insuetus]
MVMTSDSDIKLESHLVIPVRSRVGPHLLFVFQLLPMTAQLNLRFFSDSFSSR